MNDEETLVSLNSIFRDVLKSPQLVLKESDTASDVEGWDSLNHVILIGAIESRFGIKFRLKELMSMESVGDISRVVREKTSQA